MVLFVCLFHSCVSAAIVQSALLWCQTKYDQYHSDACTLSEWQDNIVEPLWNGLLDLLKQYEIFSFLLGCLSLDFNMFALTCTFVVRQNLFLFYIIGTVLDMTYGFRTTCMNERRWDKFGDKCLRLLSWKEFPLNCFFFLITDAKKWLAQTHERRFALTQRIWAFPCWSVQVRLCCK